MTATTRTDGVRNAGMTISQRLVIGLVSIVFGSALIFGVGLAQNASLHNAAHDTRHSLGFPCH